MTDKPKALELAQELEYSAAAYGLKSEAAAELRRLHEVNQRLVEALRYCVRDIGGEWGYDDDTVILALAALAKAKEST